jgi:uncharacterized lipoprotein YajG
MMRYLILPVLAAVALAGCASEPRVVNSTPPGVSYRFSGDNVAEANARADRYCAQYGKRAQLQGVTRGASDNIAAYQCG